MAKLWQAMTGRMRPTGRTLYRTVSESKMKSRLRAEELTGMLSLLSSGVATGGHGWARAHLIPPRPPVRFVQIRRLFVCVGGGVGGGGGVRGLWIDMLS